MRTSPEDIVAMATFASVVEAKSFTEAARALGVSKSVVSARVSRLEERLGVCLLHRTTRRFALTADGVRLYERCARVVSAAEEAAQTIDDASDPPRGVLRVHLPLAFAQAQLARPLVELTRLHPSIKLDLRLDDRVPDLATEGLDVAIVLAQRLADPSLVARKIASDHLVVCAAPSYLRRKGIPFRPQDLIHHDRITHASARREGIWGKTGPQPEWHFTTDEGPLSLDASEELVIDSTAFIRDAALAGHGIAMLPSSVIDGDLRSGRLHRVLDEFHELSLGVYAVHLHARFVPARVRAFIDHLAEHFHKASWKTAPKAPTVAEPSKRTKARRIPMTQQDVRRLSDVAAVYKEVDAPAAERLLQALGRTEVIAASRMPPSVVTMNSRCLYRDKSGHEVEASLVYPWDSSQVSADGERISVLSPLGNAMLGAAVGEKLPTGWAIEAIRYQPEAAGDHHL